MSDLYKDARKGTLTGDGLKELAKIVADKLPEGSVVVAAVRTMEYDVESDKIVHGDTIEYQDAVAGGEKPESIIVAKLQERIHGALDQFTEKEDEWSFDNEAYPVLMFTIESDFDYYCIVAVTVDMQEDAEVDEPALLQEMIDHIEANAPTSDYMEEAEPGIYLLFGTLTDPSICYDEDFDEDDEEDPDDEEEPEGE